MGAVAVARTEFKVRLDHNVKSRLKELNQNKKNRHGAQSYRAFFGFRNRVRQQESEQPAKNMS